MADQRISELPQLDAVPAGGNIWLVVVHNGETKKIRLSVALGQ